MMRNLKPFLAAAIALPLAACVSFGEAPPARLLTLTADQAVRADQPRTASSGQVITILVPTVPQALATTRVAVNDGPNAIAYVKDAAWSEAPARLFRALLAEKVSAVTGRVVLDPRQSSLDPGVRVTGQLQRFGYDAPQAQAVAVYDAVLSRRADAPVETRRFEARVPVATSDGAAVASGLNTASNQIATELAAWITR
jgi:cholesterol transport system auxiliary component